MEVQIYREITLHLKVLSDICMEAHRIGAKRIDEFYSINYMQWLHNSVISVYKNSLAEYSGRDKRYKLINDFLNLYKVYHKSLKSYKKIKSKALYIPLWKIGSTWLIDIVLKYTFNSKFQSNDERPKECLFLCPAFSSIPYFPLSRMVNKRSRSGLKAQ